jgi:hypothetical protein
MKAMLAPEMRVEVRLRDPPLIPFVTLGPRTLIALHLALRPSLLVPVFLPFLLLTHVLLTFRLLHLAFVLLAFRMPVSTLRLLRWMSLTLWSHVVPVPALWRFIPTFVRPCLPLRMRLLLRPSLFLPILWLRIFGTFVLMFVLRRSQGAHTQQQRSTNPAHD